MFGSVIELPCVTGSPEGSGCADHVGRPSGDLALMASRGLLETADDRYAWADGAPWTCSPPANVPQRDTCVALFNPTCNQ